MGNLKNGFCKIFGIKEKVPYKVSWDGIDERYDEIYCKNEEFVVFKNNDIFDIYYLYCRKNKKLIAKSIGMEIKIYYENICIIEKSQDCKYLFVINLEDIDFCNSDCLVFERDTIFEDYKDNKLFTFISEYYFEMNGLYFKDVNEMFYLDKDSSKTQYVKIPYNKDLKDCTITVYEFRGLKNITFGLIINDHSGGRCSNLYDMNSKKFISEKFVEGTYENGNVKEYNDNIFFIFMDNNYDRTIIDKNGKEICKEPLAKEYEFHSYLPYIITKKDDRCGLISLEERKVIFRPIYVDIIIDEDEYLVLDSVGGAYKTIPKEEI